MFQNELLQVLINFFNLINLRIKILSRNIFYDLFEITKTNKNTEKKTV